NEVVTTSFYKKNAAKESVSMDVVNKNVIKNTNVNDLGEAVSKTPGVLVQDGQITIRGGSSYSYGTGTRTAVLVDNLGMTSADLSEGQTKLVPIENTKQVEVIKGASSVVYGSSALNGIVNVITEWPSDAEPKTDIDLNTTFFDAPKDPRQRWWDGGTPFTVIGNVNHQRKIKDLQLVVGGNITGSMGYL
ncbi:MAG: Plug domain-containing protein, partial [Chitinophagales bacterium]|nr:Plug domain-containing protein [Chitinophagales bacterium]